MKHITDNIFSVQYMMQISKLEEDMQYTQYNV